jgi:hypothetical protein
VSVYRIISAEKVSFPVSVMCEVLGVSRSGFHGWERRAQSDRALSEAWLSERIKEIHERARGVYGSRRVSAELRLGQGVEVSENLRRAAHAIGIQVSRKRVKRLMRLAQGWCRASAGARRSECPAGGSLMTWSNATSGRRLRTCCGSRT